ncbi:MAG: metal ABC transporter solute-binding protein, Zn/Mn family [Burkholderiaceae bacterium]
MKRHDQHRRTALRALPLACCPTAWASKRGLSVVASFSILADLVRQVGGPDVNVVSLVGADADAHVFEPSPRDARTVGDAGLLVINGLGFEGWIDRLKKSVGFRGLEVVASRRIKARRLGPRLHAHSKNEHAKNEGHGHHHHPGELDPHAWHDVANVLVYVDNIAQALAQADPPNAAGYRTRVQAYSERLRALDAAIRRAIGALPAQRRTILTTHDSFGYYADAYGLRILPVRGLSNEAEPSAREIARLADRVRKERIAALFLENITDPRLIEQLARETRTAIGGRLYSDALSGPTGTARSYIELMETNTATLVSALAPPAAGRA